jgi:hypothetical protein
MRRFAIVSTGWKIASSAIPAEPDPNNLARLDSFSRAAAIGGDIVCVFFKVYGKRSKRNGTPKKKTETLELTQQAEPTGVE